MRKRIISTLKDDFSLTFAGLIALSLIGLGGYYAFQSEETKDQYLKPSKFQVEQYNPPLFYRHILVRKGSANTNSEPPRWMRKPATYKEKADETAFYGTETSGFSERPVGFPSHLFGTDEDGRDVFRLVFLSLSVYVVPALTAIGICWGLGALLGIFGSKIWTGGWSILGFVTQCVLSAIESLPKYVFLLLAVILVHYTKRPDDFYGTTYGFWHLSIILGGLSAPQLGRHIMERIDTLKKREFIDAAFAIGLSKSEILLKHILYYNCLLFFSTQAIILISDLIMVEISLTYLAGLSQKWGANLIVSDLPSLGKILNAGKASLIGYWWMNLFPLLIAGLCLFSTHRIADKISETYAMKRAPAVEF